MLTLRLRVNKKIYENLMWFLKKFSSDELQIIEEDEKFVSLRKELNNSLEQVENETTDYIDIQQLDDELEATIKKYEA